MRKDEKQGELFEESKPKGPVRKKPESLVNALTKLLNSRSRENISNTPDFILANFMMNCLKAFEEGQKKRDMWCKPDICTAWQDSYFDGSPPAPFESWIEFLKAPVKAMVYVRALKPEDLGQMSKGALNE